MRIFLKITDEIWYKFENYVPGPDGKFGYGGKCFPKDVNAFAKMTEGTPLGTLLEHLHELNVHFRGVEEHI